MASFYSPQRPRARGPAITFKLVVGLLGLAFLGLLCGGIVVHPRPEPVAFTLFAAWALMLGDFLHLNDRIGAGWCALTFAIGFDLGALVLPRLPA